MAAVPAGLATERLGGEASSWKPVLWGLGFTAVALVLAGMSIWGHSKWVTKNGSMYFASAQPSDDLDLPRIAHAIDNHPTQLFHGPLLHREVIFDPNEPSQAARKRITKDIAFLFKPNDPSTTTHIVTNMIWPIAIACGYNLDRDLKKLVIWHLVTNPQNDLPDWKPRALRKDKPVELLGRALIDVMDGAALLNDPLPTLKRTGAVFNAQPVTSSTHLSLAIEYSRTLNGTYDQRLTWPTVATAEGQQTMRFANPTQFADMALLAASEIATALNLATDQGLRLEIAAAMPKPVAFAVGLLLRERFRIRSEQLASVDFIIHGYPPRSYAFFGTTTTASDDSLINLTAHKIRIFDEHNKVAVELEASDRPARISETYRTRENHPTGNQAVTVDFVTYGPPHGLPQPTDGCKFVVSRVFAAAHPDRHDLVFPLDEVRNETNQIVGCRRLGTFAKE